MPNQVQWSKLNECLLQCGAVHDPMKYCCNALRRLKNVVPFDQGRVYFLDDRGEVFDEFLIGVSKKVTRAYHEYYADSDGGTFDATRLARAYAAGIMEDELPLGESAHVNRFPAIDWSEQPHDTKFYREHLEPQGIRHSTGFSLFDLEGRPRAIFCLDRTRVTGYSADELTLLSLAATHLDNAYRNFFAQPPTSFGDAIALLTSDLPLTGREIHIATLIVRGASTKSIASTLGISKATVYKHISNIHRKMGVSCHSELVAKLNAIALYRSQFGSDER